MTHFSDGLELGDADGGGARTIRSRDGGPIVFPDGISSPNAVSALDYGIVGDNSTDNSTAFQTAVTALAAEGGGILTLPGNATYVVSAGFTLADNVAIQGVGLTKPKIRLVSASGFRLFNFTGVDKAGLYDLELDGTDALGTGSFVLLSNATKNRIVRCDFVNATDGTNIGAVLLSGTSNNNVIQECTFTGTRGSAIGLSGASVQNNQILHNIVTNATGFGVRVGDGANRNLVQGNRTTSNGIELVGVTGDSHLNQIIGNYAEGTGDNGISLSGYDNVCIGNHCYRNQKAGIWSWGSGNVITGNHCRDNNQEGTSWAGIGVSSNYGGTGQFNVITGNVCEDTQAVVTQSNAIRISGATGYTAWGAGQVITSGTYRINGLNIYIATNSGTTGATAPVHTSGTVSDGAVSWRYLRSFTTVADSVFNQVFGNSCRGGASPVVDTSATPALNMILDATLTRLFTSSGNLRIGAPTGAVVFVSNNNVDQARFDSNVFRPEVDNAYALGLTNRRFSQIHANEYRAGPSGSTLPVLSQRRTGWGVPTGTPTRSTFDTASVTLPQLAERVKALIDDLTSHGMIGA